MSNKSNYDESYNEILFWKVYHNSFIRNTIFLNFEPNVVYEIDNCLKYKLGYRIKFSKLNSLEWFIEKREINLLNYFLENDHDKVIVANENSIRLLFSRYHEYEILSKILLSKRIKFDLCIDKSELDLVKVALEFDNKNALSILLNEMNVQLNELNGDRYLYFCKTKEIFEMVFNKVLNEKSIDIYNYSSEQANYLKCIFSYLFSINQYRYQIETLLSYSNLIDMSGLLDKSDVFFNIKDIKIMKKLVELNIYKPKKISNVKIYLPFKMNYYTFNQKDTAGNYYKNLLDDILFYIDVLLKYHLEPSSNYNKYKNQFNQITNYLNQNSSDIQLEFVYIQKLIDILNEERFDLDISVERSIKFTNGILLNTFKLSKYDAKEHFSVYENKDAFSIIFETLNVEALKEVKVVNTQYAFLHYNYNLKEPINVNRLIEFIKLYTSTYCLPDRFIKVIFEKCDTKILKQLVDMNIMEFKDLIKLESCLYKLGDFDKLKWFIQLKALHMKKGTINTSGQINHHPFCLKSIDQISFIKDNISIISNVNFYTNFNSLQLLIHFSNNLDFNCLKDLIKQFKNSLSIQTVLVPWIKHLNDIGFRCFNFKSFNILILNLLEIFDNDYDFINLNIQFNSLSKHSTYLLVTSILNINYRLLHLLIQHYKISIDYDISEFKQLNVNKSFRANHNLDQVLQVSRLLFGYIKVDSGNGLSKHQMGLLNPLFNNLYLRVLSNHQITLKQVLQIKNEFLNNNIDLIDSKINTHLYLIVKSNRFYSYITQFIDPAPLKIENTLKSQFNSLWQPNHDGSNNVNSNYALKSRLLNSVYPIDLSLDNIIKHDFDSLFITLSNEIKSDIKSDFKFLLDIHNLNLLESILKLKSDKSNLIEYDINILNQFFDHHYFKNIESELTRINK